MTEVMFAAIILAIVGFGLGPLLGVAVDRLVEREPFVPTHRCQRCRADLGGASGFVPFASWRRRCPDDPSHPRWRYPLIDVSTAAVFAVAGWRFGFTWQLWPYLVFFAALVVMSVIDIEEHLLLNVLTYPTMLAGVFAVLILSGPNGYSEAVNPALISAAVFGVAFLLLHLAYPPGMGLGDVKLIPSLALFIAWLTVDPFDGIQRTLYMFLGASFALVVIGFSMRAWAKRQPPERFAHHPEEWIPGEVPMGPFLAVATVVTVALTQPASLAG